MPQSLDDSAITDLLRRVRASLGVPTKVFHVPLERQPARVPHVDVLFYAARRGDAHLLVTSGMSLAEMPVSPKGRRPEHPRIELYLRVRIDRVVDAASLTSVSDALWRLATFPFRADPPQHLGAFHLLGGLPPVVTGSRLNAFVLLPPAPAHSFAAKLAKAAAVPVYEAFAITERERRQVEWLLAARRPDRIAHAFGGDDRDPIDPLRAEIDVRAMWFDG